MDHLVAARDRHHSQHEPSWKSHKGIDSAGPARSFMNGVTSILLVLASLVAWGPEEQRAPCLTAHNNTQHVSPAREKKHMTTLIMLSCSLQLCGSLCAKDHHTSNQHSTSNRAIPAVSNPPATDWPSPAVNLPATPAPKSAARVEGAKPSIF